LQLKRHK